MILVPSRSIIIRRGSRSDGGGSSQQFVKSVSSWTTTTTTTATSPVLQSQQRQQQQALVPLLDRIRICPRTLAKMYDWHLSSRQKKSTCTSTTTTTATNRHQQQRLLPNTLSMCVYPDRIDLMNVSSVYNNHINISNSCPGHRPEDRPPNASQDDESVCTTTTTTTQRRRRNQLLPWWRTRNKNERDDATVTSSSSSSSSSPWWNSCPETTSVGKQVNNNNNNNNSSSSSSSTGSSDTTSSTVLQSISLKYRVCGTTRQRVVSNARDVMEQLQTQLVSSSHGVPHNNTNDKSDCHTAAATTTTVSSNNGILIVYWPIKRSNGRRGYDCGRVMFILEQLFQQYTTATTSNSDRGSRCDNAAVPGISSDDSISSSSYSSSSRSSNEIPLSLLQLPSICLYDPTRTICDEDIWGRSSAHGRNNNNNSIAVQCRRPPSSYRLLRERSVLLQSCTTTKSVDNSNSMYNPQSLWTSFCTHHWPHDVSHHTETTALHTTINDTDDDDDDHPIAIPTIVSKPISVSKQTTSTPSPHPMENITKKTQTITNRKNVTLLTAVPQPAELLSSCLNDKIPPRRRDDHDHVTVPIAPTSINRRSTSGGSGSHHHHHHRINNCTPLAAKRFVNFDLCTTAYTSTTTTSTVTIANYCSNTKTTTKYQI